MKSWKTTLVGLVTGGGVSINAIITQGIEKGWKQALLGLLLAVLGALSKDHDVTGTK